MGEPEKAAVPGTTAPPTAVPGPAGHPRGRTGVGLGTGAGGPEAAGGTTSARRGVVLAGLMLAMALVALDATVVATAVPSIVGQLGGFSMFAWLFSAYLLTQTVTIPICGKLSDVVGRKPILLAGAVVFVLGSVLAGLAWNMVVLIACRGVQGVGAGAVISTASTVVGDLYTLRERGRAQGFLASVWGVSAVVGPTVGGLLSEYASWRWIFYLNLPVGAACCYVISRYLHEHVVVRRRRFDVPGAALLAAGVGLLVFGLMEGGVAWPFRSAPSIAIFTVAAAALVAFAAQERRAAEPAIPPWLFRDRALVGANLATLAFGLVMVGLTAYLPTYAQGVLGAGPVAAGFALAAMSIGWPLASSLSSRLYLRIGFRDTAALGAVVCVAAAGMLAALPQRAPLWAAGVCSAVMGAGLGLNSSPLLIGVQSLVGWDRRGVVTGANMSMRFLGQTVGAALFAGVANATLASRLAAAPEAVRGQLPDVDRTSQLLDGGPPMSPEATEYLRSSLYSAAHHVFLAVLVAAAGLLVVLLVVTPRRLGRTDQHSG